MYEQVEKPKENKSRVISQKKSNGKQCIGLVDNRPEAVAQRKLQSMADKSFFQQQQSIQKKLNNTGLPDNLKSGIENLSGYSMDDVKVHYNSDKPAQLQAHAYAQGADIHLGSGQEKHLPHEAWHVVQQKQGWVKPTMQMHGKVNINDEESLEKEADVMGRKAMQATSSDLSSVKSLDGFQLKSPIIQRLPKFKNQEEAIIYFEDTMLDDMEVHLHDLELLKQEAVKSNWEDLLERITYYSSQDKTLVALQIKRMDLADSSNFEIMKRILGIVQENAWDDLEELLLPAFRKLEGKRDDSQPRRKGSIISSLRSTGAKLIKAAGAENYNLAVKLAGRIHDLIWYLDPNISTTLPTSKAVKRTEGDLMKALGDYFKKPFATLIAPYILSNRPQLIDYIATYINNNPKCHAKLNKFENLDYTQKGNQQKVATEIVKLADIWVKKQLVGEEGIANLAILAVDGIQHFKMLRDEKAKSTPSEIMQSDEFREAYFGMIKEKYFQEKLKDKSPEKKDLNIKEAFLETIRKETEKPSHMENSNSKKVEDKLFLLHHLNLEPKKYLKESLADIIIEGLNRRAETIMYLFDDHPDLLTEARKIRKAEIHPTLQSILKGDVHSITNINDYVGDKLNDPLMHWVMRKHIPVVVHATSILASFAQLKSEGFSDIVEIPSSHKGTSKYVAYNPKTKQSKVVFQTMLGESYQIQTTGAFLFYELREFDNKLVENIDKPTDGPFKYQGYLAKLIVKVEKNEKSKRVLYLLVDEKTGNQVLAEIPFLEEPFPIDNGAIILKGIDKESINIRNIERLNPEQLTVFEEKTDYQKMYTETLAMAGVKKIDIAVLGGSGDLERQFSTSKITHAQKISLLQFNATIYELNSELVKNMTLFSCQISPDFFGNRTGELAKALEEFGMKYLIFTGTAGGLGKGHRVGDIVVPKKLQNFAEGTLSGEPTLNQGLKMVKKLDISAENLKLGGSHVGVHSPITESAKMIESMKQQSITSVDCEAGFIADALASSKVSLYQFFYVSDLPGTESSIGMGGLASDKHAKKEDVTTSDLIMEAIKQLIGHEITDAQSKVDRNPYPIKGDSIKVKNGLIHINILLPELAKLDGSVTGLLNLFADQISGILVKTGGQINVESQKAINELIQKFHNAHQIVVSVEFEM
mgnify:CR=1 FL=1